MCSAHLAISDCILSLYSFGRVYYGNVVHESFIYNPILNDTALAPVEYL